LVRISDGFDARLGQTVGAPAHKRAPGVDARGHRFVVTQIGYPDLSAERQGAVRGGFGRLTEAFATGGFSALEFHGVVGGFAVLDTALGVSRSGRRASTAGGQT